MIIEPSAVSAETRAKLSEVGWGVCRVPSLDYLREGGNYSDALGKLYLWNMTQYSVTSRIMFTFMVMMLSRWRSGWTATPWR